MRLEYGPCTFVSGVDLFWTIVLIGPVCNLLAGWISLAQYALIRLDESLGINLSASMQNTK